LIAVRLAKILCVVRHEHTPTFAIRNHLPVQFDDDGVGEAVLSAVERSLLSELLFGVQI
jgi:hypothetical protein